MIYREQFKSTLAHSYCRNRSAFQSNNVIFVIAQLPRLNLPAMQINTEFNTKWHRTFDRLHCFSTAAMGDRLQAHGHFSELSNDTNCPSHNINQLNSHAVPGYQRTEHNKPIASAFPSLILPGVREVLMKTGPLLLRPPPTSLIKGATIAASTSP